jgi:hypothetical protein
LGGAGEGEFLLEGVGFGLALGLGCGSGLFCICSGLIGFGMAGTLGTVEFG